MAIYKNGVQIKSKEVSLNHFTLKVQEIVKSKGFTIHNDSDNDKNIAQAFKTLNYDKAINCYIDNAVYWGD